jgi:hypothetical protein
LRGVSCSPGLKRRLRRAVPARIWHGVDYGAGARAFRYLLTCNDAEIPEGATPSLPSWPCRFDPGHPLSFCSRPSVPPRPPARRSPP